MKFHHLMTKKRAVVASTKELILGEKILKFIRFWGKKWLKSPYLDSNVLASLQFIAGFQKYLLFSVAKSGYIGEGNAVSIVWEPALVRRVEGIESAAGAFLLVTNKMIWCFRSPNAHAVARFGVRSFSKKLHCVRHPQFSLRNLTSWSLFCT
jgi:hypothetical protein